MSQRHIRTQPNSCVHRREVARHPFGLAVAALKSGGMDPPRGKVSVSLDKPIQALIIPLHGGVRMDTTRSNPVKTINLVTLFLLCSLTQVANSQDCCRLCTVASPVSRTSVIAIAEPATSLSYMPVNAVVGTQWPKVPKVPNAPKGLPGDGPVVATQRDSFANARIFPHLHGGSSATTRSHLGEAKSNATGDRFG